MSSKDIRSKLHRLLTSQDADAVIQGVELFVAIDDPALWDEVLDGVEYTSAPDRVFGHPGHASMKLPGPGRLISNGFFAWNSRTTRWDEQVLRVLVANSSHPVKAQVSALDVGGMYKKGAWLPVMLQGIESFPNLQELIVYTGPDPLDLSVLGELPALKSLHVRGTYAFGRRDVIELPKMDKLEELELDSSATISLAAMPNVRSLTLGAPVRNAEHLRTVQALSLSYGYEEDVLGVFENLEVLSCTAVRSPEIVVPPGAKLVEGSLKLYETTGLGNLSTLRNLRSLTIVPPKGDVHPAIDALETLRDCADLTVLDIRGHEGIDTIDFLEGHANLRLVAVAGSGVQKSELPPGLKAITSAAKQPDLKGPLAAPTEDPVPVAPATKLTASQKKTIARLKKLLLATDHASITQGVELVVSLNDDAIWNYLLDGVSYREGGTVVDKNKRAVDVVGRLTPNKLFTGTLYRQPWHDVALAQLVARSQTPLRRQVTHLALGQWSYSTTPLETVDVRGLGGFDNLVELQLMDAKNYNLEALPEMRRLNALHLDRPAQIPSHPTLRSVTSRRSSGIVEFLPDQKWPELVSVAVARLHGADSLAAGAPQLRTLSCEGSQPAQFSGFDSLESLTVWMRGPVGIRDCPRLTNASIGLLVDATGVPSLEQLELSTARSFDFVSGLPQRTTISVELPAEIDRVQVPASAAFEGPLQLKGVTDLADVAKLDPRVLKLIDVDAPLSLDPLAGCRSLRVLDIRGCAGVTDLSPLCGLAELRLVAIHDSGVAAVPDELARAVSRAKEVDIESAASKESAPVAATSTRRIPVPEEQRAAWDTVLTGLATTDLDVALGAIETAAALDAGGLEFLLSKIKVSKDQLRSRPPFRLPSRLLLPPIVARILSHMAADSVAAAPFRRMRRLVVEGERRGAADVSLVGLDQFPLLEDLVVLNARAVTAPSLASTTLTNLVIDASAVDIEEIPGTLVDVVLDCSNSFDLGVFAREHIESLRLNGTNQNLEPLFETPPQRILLPTRVGASRGWQPPAELEDRLQLVPYARMKHYK